MLDPTVLTKTREVPLFFPAREEQLFGVLTFPAATPLGTGVIVLVGGSYIPATNRNRLSVRLARALAARGFHVLRVDYHGVGESTGEINYYDLGQPFVADLEGAIAVMRRNGLRRLILIGSCFGSRTILAIADQIPELTGAVLMATPIGDFLMGDRLPLKVARGKSLPELARMALRPKTLRSIFAPPTPESRLRMRNIYKRTVALKARLMLEAIMRSRRSLSTPQGLHAPVSAKFTESFRKAVERGVPLLFLYGQDDEFSKEFSQARQESLRSVFENARAPLDVQTVDGSLHGFTTLAVQDAAFEQTIAWLERLIPASSRPQMTTTRSMT